MQQKKHSPNPQVPSFNIRKLNKKHHFGSKYNPEFTPESDHQKKKDYSNSSYKKQKELMLIQTVDKAIINSKAYLDLKKLHAENKKKNVEDKKEVEAKIENCKKEKKEALEEKARLQAEKQKYLQTIVQLKQKINTVKDSNKKYIEDIQKKVPGDSEYISNLIMSIRFQAEYEHDINPDEMTYEELLELEEKIGVVSKGVSAQLIGTLKKIQIQQDLGEKCAVCYGEYEKGETMTKIESCGHDFHLDCLSEWLKKEKVCPVCKQEIFVSQKVENV